MSKIKYKKIILNILLITCAAPAILLGYIHTATAKTVDTLQTGNMNVEFWDSSTVVIQSVTDTENSSLGNTYPNIKKIIVAEGITQLPEGLFQRFPYTKSLELPASLKSLGIDNEGRNVAGGNYGAYVSHNLKNLNNISVKSTNKFYMTVDGVLYSKDGTKLIIYPQQKKNTEYIVPDSIKNFYLVNSYLEEITLGKNTNYINLETSSLTTFHVSRQNKLYMAIDGVLYSKNKKILKSYPQGKKDTSFTISDTIEQGYIKNSYIKTLTLGANINQIFSIELSNLSAYKVSSKNKTYSEIDGVLFSKDKKTLIQYPDKKGLSYQVPEGTIKIGNSAFFNKNLTNIVLPHSLRVIGRNVFSGTDISKITLPANITYFSTDTFDNTKITHINVDADNQIMSSLDGIVYTKDSSQLLYWPEARAEENLEFPENLTVLDFSKIKNPEKAKTIIIPKSLTSIINTGNNSLKEVKLAAGNNSFALSQGILYTSNLTEIKLYPNNNPITKIILPEQVVTIHKQMFLHENTTTSIKLSKNLKYLYSDNELYNQSVRYMGFNHLREVLMPEENPYFTAVDGILYAKDMSYLYWYPQNSSLEIYVMPDTVTGIAPMELVNAANITKLELPSAFSINDLSDAIFWEFETVNQMFGTYCPKLSCIKVAEGNKELTAVDGVLYTKDQSVLLLYPCAKADKSFMVPEGVHVINNRTYNPYLEEIKLSKNVDVLHGFLSDTDYAYNNHSPFLYFTALKSIQVAEGNKKYQSREGVLYDKNSNALAAFPIAWNSTTLRIPSDIQYIQCKDSFTNAKNLKEIQISGSIKYSSYQGKLIYKDGKTFISPGSNRSVISDYESKLLHLNITPNDTYTPEVEIPQPIGSNSLIDKNLKDTYYVSKDKTQAYAGEKTIYITEETDNLNQIFTQEVRQVEKIILAEGIVKVPSDVFNLFPNVKELNFPSTFYSILDDRAEEVHNILLIARKIRNSFPNLSAVNVGAENDWFSSIDGVLYDRQLTSLYLYPAGKEETSYIIPDTVTNISIINESNDDGYLSVNQNLKEIYMGAQLMYPSYTIMKKYFINLETVKLSPYNVYFKLINGKPVTMEAYR